MLALACTKERPPAAATTAASVTRAPFGTAPDGTPVDAYTLVNTHGIRTRILTYGGIVQSIETPDRAGKLDDVVLGFDDLQGYVKSSPYFGAIVGRYGNRIARGRFTLDGKTYTLAINNGPNHLHGGIKGFDKVVWTAQPFSSDSGVGVVLTHTSPDGDEGYPGTLRAKVTYTLTNRDELAIDYEATTDKATPVNLTNHTYWNLAGDGSRDVLGHVVTLESSAIVPVDSTLIPTGALMPVDGTPFDFRKPTAVGARIEDPHVQIRYGRGYDHTFVLDRAAGTALSHAAHITEPTTGRTLDIYTTEPGVQFYSGNFLDGSFAGKPPTRRATSTRPRRIAGSACRNSSTKAWRR
ncbi:MAG: galactose-1-epimerase [Gemmatimonadetes bacterium]|nr:MAG: galactose-1-epimerase [Gemmatimonadota bacterium]